MNVFNNTASFILNDVSKKSENDLWQFNIREQLMIIFLIKFTRR